MLFLSSCRKDNIEESLLKVEYDYSQKISEKGGTASFNIKANLDWVVSNSDDWIINVSPKQGNGNQTVTVAFGPNSATSMRSSIFVITASNIKEEVLITQVAGKLPSAAGAISGGFESSESITFTIAEIENADTYKWYKDGSEVQNSVERTYVATTSGVYTVAGVNAVGEGQSSPKKVVSITTPLVFNDLPEGTFIATGTPKANAGGYMSWNGTVTKKTEGTKSYYIISHWGGSQPEFNYDVPLQYKDGHLIVDNETLVVTDDQSTPGVIYYGYFEAFYVDANKTLHFIDGFSPKYDKKEATISFSGTYNGYSVYVGVIALLDNEYAGVFSEIYENASVIITPGIKGQFSKPFASGISSEKVHTNKLLNFEKLKYGTKVQFNSTKFLSE